MCPVEAGVPRVARDPSPHNQAPSFPAQEQVLPWALHNCAESTLQSTDSTSNKLSDLRKLEIVPEVFNC